MTTTTTQTITTYKTLVIRRDKESGEIESIQTFNLPEKEALLQAFFDDDLFDFNDWENEKYYFDETPGWGCLDSNDSEDETKIEFDQCNPQHRKDAIEFIYADSERHSFIKTFAITSEEQYFDFEVFKVYK